MILCSLTFQPTSPDVIVVNENHREVFILEVGCTFDYSLEEAFLTKVVKYHQLVQTISQLGYRCKLLVFIFGSRGHVHKLVVRGLQMAGLSKRRAKQLAKYCSVSAIIGSRSIWRRRCFLYPWSCPLCLTCMICNNVLSYMHFVTDCFPNYLIALTLFMSFVRGSLVLLFMWT